MGMISFGIKKPLSILFGVSIILLLGTFAAAVYWMYERQQAVFTEGTLRSLDNYLLATQEHEARKLEALLDAISRIEELQLKFIGRDRAGLLATVRPIYEKLNHEHGITHFYFTGPDRVNFLRVHKPSRFGERIERWTTTQAANSGEFSYGFELGPLGNFTMRGVIPWKRAGVLIGFLELGVEISHLAEELEEATGVVLHPFVMRNQLNRVGALDPNTTSPNPSQELLPVKPDNSRYSALVESYLAMGSWRNSKPVDTVEVLTSSSKDNVIIFTLPLRDVECRLAGILVALQRERPELVALRNDIHQMGAVIVGSAAVLLLGFFFVLRRVESNLEVSRLKLKITELRLWQMIDLLPHYIFAKDRQGRYLMVNRALAELFRQRPQAMVGRHLADFYSSPEQVERILEEDRAVIASGRKSFIAEGYLPVGEQILEVTKIPFVVAETEEPAVLVVAVDITEHKRTETELQHARLDLEHKVAQRTTLLAATNEQLKEEITERRAAEERAKAASVAKSSFLANMSHEIRTPLNAISGFSQILLKHSGSLPGNFPRYLENIYISARNLSELVNNILDFSKIEAGKMELSTEEINLRLLVQGVFHINRAQALQKQLEYQLSYDPNLPTLILSDRTSLNQILINLTANAVKFTPEGKMVRLSAARADNHMVFQVVDAGIGIPPERQAVIFEPFEQVDSSMTRQFGGSGLGLAIVKKRVELLGGTISCTSVPEVGSVFTVSLPLVEVQLPQVATPEQGWQAGIRFTQVPILVVEDNRINQEMIVSLFRELGLEVTLATNGTEGVAKAVELTPALIFMDLQMPELDGIAATRKLRDHPQLATVPIIALSADAFIEQQRAALAAGMNEYLTKPLELEKLVVILRKYLSLAPATPPPSPTLPPMPEEVVEQVRENLRQLAQIPLYNAGEIIATVKAMLAVCGKYGSPYTAVLNAVEDAVFSRNSEKIPELIKLALGDE